MTKAEAISISHEPLSSSSFQKLIPLHGREPGVANRFGNPGDRLLKPDAPQKNKLCIPSLRGFQVIDIRDIIYCEASSNYTNFHFTNRPSICSSKTIFEYEELLADCNFIRIHRSFVVNLEHIKEYIRGEGGLVILSNNHEIEVSRRKKDLLMTRMKEYYKF